MAQPTPAPFSTYDALGNREDLTDVIYMITPTHTPFYSMIPRVKATATLHEWNIDVLAGAAQNAVIEGDDATTDVGTPTTRPGNRTQIADKVPRVTGTQEVVSKAGRRSEMAHQVMKRSKELKRDIENDLLANTAVNAGNDTTARISAGIETWIATNDVFSTGGGTDGASPTGDGSDTRTDAVPQVAFTETNLQTALQLIFVEGGDPDCIMVGAFNKQKFSTFSGNATRNVGAADRKLFAAIDIYESDFGDLEVIVNRFQRARTALILQKDMWALAILRPFRLVDLAKDGDSERKQLILEYSLEARNEAASGGVFDLLTA